MSDSILHDGERENTEEREERKTQQQTKKEMNMTPEGIFIFPSSPQDFDHPKDRGSLFFPGLEYDFQIIALTASRKKTVLNQMGEKFYFTNRVLPQLRGKTSKVKSFLAYAYKDHSVWNNVISHNLEDDFWWMVPRFQRETQKLCPDVRLRTRKHILMSELMFSTMHVAFILDRINQDMTERLELVYYYNKYEPSWKLITRKRNIKWIQENFSRLGF